MSKPIKNSLKLNKVHDNLYVDGLDIIHNKYLFNGKGDLSYCMGNSSNFLENMIINNFSIAASIPKNAFSSYEFPQDLQIKNIFSGTIKNLFSKFKITFSNESFSEGSITIKFNSIDDVSLVGEKIYTILQKDDLNKFVKTNAPDFLSGEFKLLNNLELTTNFRTILNSFTLIDSKFNIENGYIKSNIGLEKLDGNWKIKNTNSFHDFSLYSFYQKLGKMKVNGISTINTLVSDFKKIGFLDLKVSLDSFQFNNQKLSEISILLNKKSNERYNLKTNINDENLKLVLSSSLSAQFEKILNLKSSLHFSNFSYSLNPSNNKRKNIFFDIDYNGKKSPGTILLNNISLNETPFSPFVLNFKTSSNKENQIFSDNEAFNLSLLS